MRVKSIIFVAMLSKKKLYKSFCEEHPKIPLFLQFDWYDQLFENEEWDVAIAYHGDVIVGIMPYMFSNKWFYKRILPPHFTPYQGPWLIYPDISRSVKKRAFEKKVLFDLIEQVPKVSVFTQQFHPLIKNWLPFHWKGFKEQTKYTYLLDNIKNEEPIFQGFKNSLRREIRKAERNLTVTESMNFEALINLKHRAYEAKKEKFNYSSQHMKRVYAFIQNKECGVLLEASDDKSEIHAMILIVWDEYQAYYLIGAANPDFKTSGAMSLLMWKGIQEASKHVDVFNFEGSMIPSIERYFRSFGGALTPYFRVTRNTGLIANLLELR